MTHLIFVGPGNTGKTTMVNLTTHELLQLGFQIVPYQAYFDSQESYRLPVRGSGEDFYVLLKRENEIILSYSWSDTQNLIIWLKDLVDRLVDNNFTPDLIVMASRDASEGMYNFTLGTMNLTQENRIEVPLGRMVRGPRRDAGVRWYIPAVENIVNQFVLPEILANF